MPDSMTGKQIDDFTIEERLGQGAMAIVYRAHQPSINRFVALKVIRLDEGQGLHDDFRKRFAREAAVIAGLEHIHILPIYAYGINTEMAYLAMRWLKGGSLSQVMRKDRLSIERAADIFNQIAKGLAYAHSKGVIHRDLKPSNIMLDDTGNAYLTDFGLAKLVEGSGEITKTGNIVGTPAYMSPEQLRGEDLDYRSDIYSLGIILYNMMVGRLPFDTTTTNLVSVIYQHLEKEPTPPSELNPGIPPAVEAVILKALQKNREDRYSSALEMANALNAALGRPATSDTSLTDIRIPSSISTHDTLIVARRFFSNARVLSIIIILLLLVLVGKSISDTISGNQLVAGQQTAVAATSAAALWTPTPLPQASVLKGEKWASSQIVPSDAQIALAKARIGQNGFIAYITCNQTSVFHASIGRELRDAANRYSLNYRVYDSDSKEGDQVALIERARSEGAVGIMLCPLNEALLHDTLTAIQESNFPLVTFSGLQSTYGSVTIGGDNYLLGLSPGEEAGKYIRDNMGGKADVIILDYPTLDYLVERANGLEDGVKKYAPDINIVGRFLGATEDFGKESVEKLIKDGVKFNFILSINDNGSFGAIDAMKEAGFDCQSVSIFSVDAEPLARQYIQDGCFIRGSASTSIDGSAHAMMDAMIQLLSGSTIAENVLIPPGTVFTKETMANDSATATAAALTPEATTAP